MMENDAILSQVILTKLGTKMEVIDSIIIFRRFYTIKRSSSIILSIIISIHDTFQIYPRIMLPRRDKKRLFDSFGSMRAKRGKSKFKSLCVMFQIGKRE